MDIFIHHIYEYEKGLRQLILYTTFDYNQNKIEDKLERKKISYVIHRISGNKINVFFGHSLCVEIVKSFKKINLNNYSNEEDFILGTLLGYGVHGQCERFLRRKKNFFPHSLPDQLQFKKIQNI